MSSTPNSIQVKYFLIGDTSKIQTITEYIGLKNQQTQLEAQQIFEKISKTLDKKLEQRNKIQSKHGNYYFTIMSPDIFYLALVDLSYSERNVFELIENVHKENIFLMVNEKGQLNETGKQVLKTLIDKFEQGKMTEESDLNKVSTIRSDVDDIKLDINRAIKNAGTNLDDVRALEQSSSRVKITAAEYQNNSRQLESTSRWHNCKLTIIIIVIVIAILLAIIIPLCV